MAVATKTATTARTTRKATGMGATIVNGFPDMKPRTTKTAQAADEVEEVVTEVTTEVRGNSLVITLPLNHAGILSGSGKSKVVAGTNGFLTTNAKTKTGKTIKISVNAIVGL